MISAKERERALLLISEAVCSGARERLACELVGISERTLLRWKNQQKSEESVEDKRIKAGALRTPFNKLTDLEKNRIIAVCNKPEFASLPPSQIVPILADKGIYIASEATFYRVLHERGQLLHRGSTKPRRMVKKPDGFKATGPNQVWSWDITYLRSFVRGMFFYLYLIEDVYSRKIVGWEIHSEESADHASVLISKACLSEGVIRENLVLHSDNGSPMRGSTMLATLRDLGVAASFSRPSVSNDNPYSESLFRTLKYCPAYPSKPFESVEAARKWVFQFAAWYNNDHRHSAIRFVTPSQRHNGEDELILIKRIEVYEAAKAKKPERWSGNTRNWEPIKEVWLNPPKGHIIDEKTGHEKRKLASA